MLNHLEHITSEILFGINSVGEFENVCHSKTIYYQLSVVFYQLRDKET